MLLGLAPVIMLLSLKLFESGNYYISAVAIIILSIVPFYVFFEKRKIKTSEIVTLSVMIALCVASRAVMAYIPQVKPTCALVIVTAIAFGPNVGFLVGSLSMFVSNFIFGQGMFTPFQMLGMGLVGFICGLIFHKKPYSNNKIAVGLVGGIACFLIYGLIGDNANSYTWEYADELIGVPMYSNKYRIIDEEQKKPRCNAVYKIKAHTRKINLNC